jgi:hypothetical protein
MREGDELYTLMEQMWAQSEPAANPPGWQWSAEKKLVDYIRALEDHLGIPRPPAPQPTAELKSGTLPAAKDAPAEVVEQPVDGAAEDTP